mmetsp:Transcript_12576/g.37363  ORF Transcript_12576/g.37363 Transcript_12576/m.37363 type:complete len:276 (-) Transcript_12576:1084-1911(-)
MHKFATSKVLPTRSNTCFASRARQEAMSPLPTSKTMRCRCALNASLSGIRPRISATSSGLVARMSWTLIPRKRSTCLSTTEALRTFKCCGMPKRWEAAISSITQALVNTCACASTAMTCSKPPSVAARNSIMSVNLLSSQGMLWPSSRTGGSPFRALGARHAQVGYGLRRIGSSPPQAESSQIALCWEIEKAQIQYVSFNVPLAATRPRRLGSSRSSKAATLPNSLSPRASATTAATRSRNRLPHECETIFRGRVHRPPIIKVAKAQPSESPTRL